MNTIHNFKKFYLHQKMKEILNKIYSNYINKYFDI